VLTDTAAFIDARFRADDFLPDGPGKTKHCNNRRPPRKYDE
jgi:hypothetical protein